MLGTLPGLGPELLPGPVVPGPTTLQPLTTLDLRWLACLRCLHLWACGLPRLSSEVTDAVLHETKSALQPLAALPGMSRLRRCRRESLGTGKPPQAERVDGAYYEKYV